MGDAFPSTPARRVVDLFHKFRNWDVHR